MHNTYRARVEQKSPMVQMQEISPRAVAAVRINVLKLQICTARESVSCLTARRMLP